MGYNPLWQYYLEVTIDHTKVNANCTDFPVYLNLADLGSGHGFWSRVRSDGGDIRVTNSDGSVEFPREVVKINTTTKVGELHFKVTGTLSSSTDTVCRIYYANAAATEPAVTATYGRNNVWTAGFEIVAHFQEDPDATGFINSTGNVAGTYTFTNEIATATGTIGNGINFAPVADIGRVEMGTITESNRDYAFSTFVKFNTNATGQAFFEYSSTGGTLGGRRVGGMYTANRLDWNHNNTDGNVEPSTTINTGTWYHFSVNSVETSLISTLATVNAWVDGTNKTTKTNYLGIDTNGSSCKIGCSRNVGEPFDGYLDELRYYKTTKADSWMVTESENLRNASTFYSIGADTYNPDLSAPVLSSSTPADGAIGVVVSANIVLNFDENVQAGTGNFTIKRYSDDVTLETIPVGSVAISGSQVTIDPTTDFPFETRLYLLADSGILKDFAGTPNNWGGISSKDTLDFTTYETTPPTLTSTTPADNATGVSRSANLQMVFSEPVQQGIAGNLKIRTLDHLYIGKSSEFSTTGYIQIGEIIVARRKLTTYERQKVEGYLAWKFDGAGTYLPNGHPYKNNRPYRD